MWQTKYASAVSKNLELGVDFRTCSEVDIFTGSVARGITQQEMKMFLKKGIEHTKLSVLSKECIIFS